MTYVSRHTTLGVSPAVVQAGVNIGTKIFGSLFGGSGAKQTYPWRWEKIPGQPNHLGIKYGTRHQFFVVWKGPIDQIFTPGFDVSGNTDRGKWRAVNDNQHLRVYEFVNGQWYETFDGSESAIKAWAGYIAPLKVVQPRQPAAPATASMMPAGMSGAMPWIIGGGLLAMAVYTSKK